MADQVVTKGGRVEATDLTNLKLPVEVDEAIGLDRKSSVIEHSIPVNFDWWNRKLNSYGLSGGPIHGTDNDGNPTDYGSGWLTRGDVFKIAEADLSVPDNVCRLLWYSLAWGAGSNRRKCDLRMQAVHDDVSLIAEGLSNAALASRIDAGVAYSTLCPSYRQRLIKNLGPAFATKFLYFAGAGHESHPCLILDSVVATALFTRCEWESLSIGPFWPSTTYVRYCDLLRRWAATASSENRSVAPDEIERALFKVGKDEATNG